MNINIFEKYEIKMLIESSTLSEENTTKYDNIFVDDNSIVITTIDGSELLEKISANLQQNYLMEFVINDNEIHFEYFNYDNGEHAHICYLILNKEVIK